MEHKGAVNCAIFSPDGTRMALASAAAPRRILEREDGPADRAALERHEGAVNCTISARTVLASSLQAQARKPRGFRNTNTGGASGPPLVHKGPVYSASFSLDGTRVVTASEDCAADFNSRKTSEPLGDPLAHGGPVYCATFSPDATHVVTASWDDTAQIWDADTHRPLGPPLRHKGLIWNANLDPQRARCHRKCGRHRGLGCRKRASPSDLP